MLTLPNLHSRRRFDMYIFYQRTFSQFPETDLFVLHGSFSVKKTGMTRPVFSVVRHLPV